MNTEISAIIVEDVREFHSVIETLLREVAPYVRIVGKATALNEAEILIEQINPELIFLDIQFEAEGKTAFDLLKKLSEQNKCKFQVIIITAFSLSEYYAEAFNHGVVHFLTKPIDKQKLKEAVERIKNTTDVPSLKTVLSQLSRLHYQLHYEHINKIVIEGLQYVELVDPNDIVYLEASGHYTYFYLKSNDLKPYCSSTNIGEYERILSEFPAFFRINRNLIINIDYVERFSKKDYTIVLAAPYPRLRASKDKFKDFMRLIEIQIKKV